MNCAHVISMVRYFSRAMGLILWELKFERVDQTPRDDSSDFDVQTAYETLVIYVSPRT